MTEPTVGLQTSQPSPPRAASRPCESSSSAYEVIPRVRTISYSSLRVYEKQPHRPWSWLCGSSWPMTLTQLPQPVPALVHFFTSGSVVCSQIAPLVTLWQEQMTASSGSEDGPRVTGPPAPAGRTSCSGATGRTVPVIGRSVPYWSASPTSTPPSSVPSWPITSFL